MAEHYNFVNKITCSLTSSLSPLFFGIVNSGASLHLMHTMMGLHEVESWAGVVETAEAAEMLSITARGRHPVVLGYCYVMTGLGDALITRTSDIFEFALTKKDLEGPPAFLCK